MKKVKWLIEKVFDRDDEFIEELSHQGFTFKETNYLRFTPSLFQQDEPVLFRGTLVLGRDILRQAWVPGAYANEKALSCTTYYSYYGNLSCWCF